jgi:AcrR family transcriptional regulator
MAGKKRLSAGQPPKLDASFWAKYTSDVEPSPRDKLLFVTMSEISRRGILDVNAGAICELLEVKPPMVNYYFGSFDGLLAEAVAHNYENWVDWTTRAVSKKSKSPSERLKTFLDSEVERSRFYGSIIVFSAYPSLSESVTAALNEKFSKRMEAIFEFHLCVVAVILNDMKTNSNTPIEFNVESRPFKKFQVTRTKELLAAASILWSISGLSLWATGLHGGTAGLMDLAGQRAHKTAMAAHINRLISSFEAEFRA